jgi:putative holliday junction resolvase
MSKIAALDVGDQWTGIALSDTLHILAKPYTTVASSQLMAALRELCALEDISTIVVGYPKTMRGTESDQTRKVRIVYEELKAAFPALTWILWDERLSSKRAETTTMGKTKTKEEKLKLHAKAAAFILDSYLTFLAV